MVKFILLHGVLIVVQVGEKFRSRSLKFPGLISGCTMDWFQRWPKDALIAVSNHFLANYDIVCTPQVKQSVVHTMGEFQVDDSVTQSGITTLLKSSTKIFYLNSSDEHSSVSIRMCVFVLILC
jgi:hypothetical protein